MNVLVFLNEGIYKFVKSALVNANKTLGVSYTYQFLVLHNLENKRPALDLCVCVFFNPFMWVTKLYHLSVFLCFCFQVSQAAAELQQYCLQNAGKDALLVGVPTGSNPFREPRSCAIVWRSGSIKCAALFLCNACYYVSISNVE